MSATPPLAKNDNLIVYNKPMFSNRLSTKSEMTTRTKLEHYGFNMLTRPASKRQSLAVLNQNKKIRANESHHSMQTRSQSSSDCHSDHLVKLFDKTLSTVTPNPVRNRQRRSDNEKNLPVLTVIPTEEYYNVNVVFIFFCIKKKTSLFIETKF
jgi:hypothetical protein